MNSILEGSYITDLFKCFEETDSGKIKEYLKAYPEEIKNDYKILEEEISIINEKAIIIAIGRKTERYLKNILKIVK